MKKTILTIATTLLLSFMGLQAQTIGCNDTVHWGTPLSFKGNECCWTVLEGPTDCFYSNYNQIDCNYDTLADHRFLSPWVEIPAFAATDSVVLIYATETSCTSDYSVAITTDGVTYDTLFRGLTNGYLHDTIFLGAYAGQVVRIQFCHYGLNSTFDPYAAGCSYAADGNWQLLFQNLQWRSLVYPVATCTVPTRTYTGDTIWLQAALTAGSHTGLTYTWHSSLTGQTWMGDTVPVVYTIGGLDTITLVVSNAYGSNTLVQTVTVIDCPLITDHPWFVDFSTDYDCWRTVGTMGWSYAERTISGFTTYGISALHNSKGANIISSPALVLPSDTTGLRLYWEDYRLSSGNATYYVLISTTDRFDITTYDTIFTCTSQTNSLTLRSVSLADYAGDTVYIAFDKMKQSSRNVYITNVQMYNELVPLGELYAVNFVVTGDTTNFTVFLLQGDTTNLTVTLHSALKDSTWTMNKDEWNEGYYGLDLAYDMPGEETVTATVSNAYGNLVLNASFSVYACDTVRTFPWEEDFSNIIGSYNVCWTISGYNHNNSYYSVGAHDEETDEVWTMDNFMMPFSSDDYMITPPIAIPAGETNMAFMVEYMGGDMDIRVSPTASNDIALFTDSLFTEPSTSLIKRRWVNLGAYAGQTIRVAIANVNHLNRVWVGLDTLPYIGNLLAVPTKTITDSATLCTVALRHGSTEGLHYTWHSALGGTITTNALGDSAWLTYSAGISSTDDTITVIASNVYGYDTVSKNVHIVDCTPALTLPWKETFADGDRCWYKPEGSKWKDVIPYNNPSLEHMRYLYLQMQNDQQGSWIMSKEIQLPADTNLAPRLFWDVASNTNNYNLHYGVLVTTSSDYTDTANYTEIYYDGATHLNWSNYQQLSVSLAQYAGQAIHIAFHNYPNMAPSDDRCICIDNVEIRSTSTPVVTLTAPTAVESHEPVTHTATLTEGSTNGLTITWHSTLMDTTWVDSTFNFQLSTFNLTYTLGGRDTITVTASNIYGSSSATAVVLVTDCSPIATLPYEETFNDVYPLPYNHSSGGYVPTCWHRYWEGSTNYKPHVTNTYLNQTAIHTYVQSDRALLLMAGVDDGWDTVATVESPLFEAPLNEQLLSFYYMYESANRGVLSVGYLQDGAFVEVASLEPQTAGRTDTVSLSAFPADVHRFALQWKYSVSSWYGVIVDNIRVFAPDTLPSVRLTAPVTAFVGDSAHFSATLSNGLPNGLTYTWHSTMLGNLNGFNGQCGVVYSAEGIDTVTVIATNAYGSDTAWAVVTVGSHPLPQVTLTAPATVVMPASATYLIALNDCSQNGLTVSWHSTMLGDLDGFSEFNVFSGQCVVVYPAEGIDTVTVIVANAYGADTAVAVVQVIDCSGAAVPYFEDFESVTAEDWNSANGNLPDCWSSIAIGASHRPKVVSSYQYMTTFGSQALLIMAGNYSGYADAAYVLLPVFSDSLQQLSVAFDYRCESANYGALTVGYWNDSLLTFHPVRNLASHTGLLYARDTVSFADVASVQHPTHTHIALKWYCNTSYYGVAVDNLEVFRDATMDITVDSVSANCVTLSWQPVDSATAYHVSVAGIIDTTVASTAVTLCGLSINSQYTASVAAIVGGEMGQGTSVAFSTASLDPAMLEVDSVGSHCVALSWNVCSGALAYNVIIDGVVDTVVADTAVVLCGLQTQTQYIARVAGINGADTGLYATMQFSTPCVIADLPWFEDFQGSSPLACWSKRGIGYYGMQICTEYYWEDYCHSGSRGLQMYNYTVGNTLVVSTPVIEAPADELLVSFWVCNPNEVGGLLEAGVITDPTDSTTFVPLMQCTMTETPTRYEFDTRNAGVSGTAALAFRTTAYCTAMIVDDINVEQISSCARLRSVGSYALDARTAVVEWQYDTASAIPNTGVLITLYDLSDNTAAPMMVTTTGNSYGFTGLALGHRYQASVQALCANDTTMALTTPVIPSGNVCAERNGDNTSSYESGWFLDNVDRPYSYSQSLYPATLAAAIDTLYGIAYHLASSAVEQYPSSFNTYSNGPRIVDVYIGQTSANSLSAPVSASNMTLAVQNYELPLTQTGWVRINFTNPVPLDGVSNLIVTLDDNTGSVYGDANFTHHTDAIGTTFYTSSSSYSYTQTYDPYNPSSFSPNNSTWIPDIQLLGGCSNANCLQPLVTVTAEDTHSISLAWQQRGTEVLWQVEYMIEGDSNWIVAGTTTDTAYSLMGLNTSTAYRVRVASICSGSAIYSDVHRVHTTCGIVSVPYYQTFRADYMPVYESSITENGTPCWQTGNIYLLSQERGLWNTHDNGDYIISPEIGANLNTLQVRLTASGSTFFLAGLKVGACAVDGTNLQWIDTITLNDDTQEYTINLQNYTGTERHIAIGGSYQTWTLYDVHIEEMPSCVPVHHVTLGYIDDNTVSIHWPPVSLAGSWAVYVDDSLVGISNDTVFTIGNLTPATSYSIGVREICSAGDTAMATSIDITTLCTVDLPWTENFDGGVNQQMPQCWYPIFRTHTGSFLNAYILGATSNPYLYFYDYYSPYQEIDSDTIANFVCSPVIYAGNSIVTVSFSARKSSSAGVFQAGIMTNPADTTSFIPLQTLVAYSSNASIYQFTTANLNLPAKYCIAFRSWAATCGVDDINITIPPLPTSVLNLAVNDSTMGSVSGAGIYETGSYVTIEAIPNEGYMFVTWSDSNTDASRVIRVESDMTLTAYFAIDNTTDTVWRTVTINPVMIDGSYESQIADMVSGAGTYADGTLVTLEGEENGCSLSFAFWVTAEGDTLYDNPYTFTITSDVIVTAVFAWFGGIEEGRLEKGALSVYPNPATTDVTIRVGEPSTFTVVDMTGREVIPPTPISSTLRLPISNLPKGVYFVKVGSAVKRLIVN